MVYVSLNFLRTFTCVDFRIDEKVFHLVKAKTEDDDSYNQTLYEEMSSLAERNNINLHHEGETIFTKYDARRLWKLLISLDFENVKQLDNIVNGLDTDGDCVGFKIKDKETGLFSTGGFRPSWSKKGKIFSSISDIKKHIRTLKAKDAYDSDGTEIIKLRETGVIDLKDVI
jgi:hypothetical protein